MLKKYSNDFTLLFFRDNNNAYSETKISAVFDVYKDTHEDLILAEGIEKLCKDLEVKPEDFKVLVLAWKFGAEQMCRFTREEFYRGMRELKTDNVKGIQARLPDCVAEVLSDPIMFKDLYRFAFRFGLDTELGQRILPVEMANSLWRVVFSQREPALLNRWIHFLEAHPHIRGIPRDTWNMFLNFVETVDNDLSTYDDTEAWPSLFDDFVEYENDMLNQNLTQPLNTSTNKSDQLQQHQLMAIDDYSPTLTIPPPAQFGDNSMSTSSSQQKMVLSPTSTTNSLHHHPHTLMSIDTSSNSGYTKIIHSSPLSPSSSSNNCTSSASAMPIVSHHHHHHHNNHHQFSSVYTNNSPTPVSASSYTTASSPMSTKLGGGGGTQQSSSPMGGVPGDAYPPPPPFGYSNTRGELSDV